ncbi:VOC family protein [Sphingomicrobium arenosum]|uniref:VOC family protein n=1 Tax=Sphingomicrobium arenosum TaxID=2233861 RepID=UPI002241050B|nr:VOC family protein [Sphingomicrobium arenosum]
MQNQHGDFIWYELMTSDADAAQRFYQKVVGWRFEDSGQAGMDYRLFGPDSPSVGGLMALTPEMQKGGARPMWAGYIGVDDVDRTAAKVADLGGTVLTGPQDIPDVGRFAFCSDPQGAPFYIMRGQSDEPSQAFAATEPRDGHCAWNELVTADPEAAQTFYSALFGWVKAEAMDMGPMGTYQMVRNGEGRDFMFGAMMKKPDAMPASLWAYYFRVPDVDAAAATVKDEGGQIINGPMEIPGGEFVFQGLDPEGAMFSLLGPRKAGG